MKTICFLTIKGGTGKTTSVLTVGTMMAKAGKRVLLIDLDPQQNLSSMYVDDDVNNVDDFCAIYNGEYKDNGKTMDALLLDKKASTREYIHKTKIKNLDIIPSTAYLAQVEVILKTSFDDVQQWILKNRLAAVQDDYDYCLLDCGPSLGILNANALGAANEVYIPTRTDGGSFTGVALMLSTIREQTYNPTLKVGGCFITEYVKQTNNAKDTYMDYMEAFARCGLDDMLLPLVIRQSSIVPNLSQKRALLLEEDPYMRNNVTKDYDVLTRLIMSEDKKKFIEENKLHEKMNKLLGFDEGGFVSMAKKTAKQEREERMARLRSNQAETVSQGGAMQGMLNEKSRGANGIERKIYYLPMEDLMPSKFNKYHKTETEIINLAANIDATELQQPLLLRALENGKYTILSGHTRYAAVEYLIKQGKWQGNQIMSIITDVVERVRDTLGISDEKAEEIVVASANTQRVKTDADILYEVEILEGLTQYYRERGIKVITEENADNLYFKAGDNLSNVRTREVIASKTGMSPAQVAKVQNINKKATDSVKKSVEEGKFSIGIANEVAKMEEEEQDAFVKEVEGKKAENKDLKKFQEKTEGTTNFSMAEFKADISDIEFTLQSRDIALTITERKQYDKAVKTIRKLICR